MLKCGVRFEVQIEFLNIIYRSFGFKGLIFDGTGQVSEIGITLGY
jgi:hypothetical protein